MNIKTVRVEKPKDINVIIGHSHFIKTVEDLYEILVTSVPGILFGIAFCEASGPCLIRWAGTDKEMIKYAKENAKRISAGHTFIIFLKNAYPINILNAIKNCQEVSNIYCATANPVEIIVAETETGNGILGVVDGERSKGIEKAEDIKERKKFLRKIGYKQ
jgi:adenosine/AMP kinase